MSLGYGYQSPVPIKLIGTKSSVNVITGNLLTAAYGGAGNTAVFNTANMSKVNFSVWYKLGAGESNTVLHVKVSSSADDTNFYQQINSSVSTGTTTITRAEYQFTGASPTSPYLLALPLDVADAWTQVAVFEDGIVTNHGTAYLEVTVSGTNK